MKQAMLFAAGLGTRLHPITQNLPKALVPVNGVPLLERNILFLRSFGVEEIVVNVHHFSDQIIAFLDRNNNFGIEIHISDERKEVLETGGGLVKAQDFFTEDFLVMNVDILTDINLKAFSEYHFTEKPLVSLAVTDRNSSRKLLFDESLQLQGWRNLKTGEEIAKKDTNKLQERAFSGIHFVSPEIFKHLPKSGKFSIIKPYLELMDTHTIKGYDHTGDILLDVGKPESIEKAEKLFI